MSNRSKKEIIAESIDYFANEINNGEDTKDSIIAQRIVDYIESEYEVIVKKSEVLKELKS